MVKVDLITGFLGAGKTTFLTKYLHYLRSNDLSIRIIENEFGNTSIDTSILENEIDDKCMLNDLTGKCMCCVGKREFINLLIEAAQTGCDRILVEPSGIYDVDEFFDVMSDSRVSSLCEIGSVITIVDPLMKNNLSKEVEYLMFSQILASGMVLVSKTQLSSEKQISEAIAYLNDIMIRFGCENGVIADINKDAWSSFDNDTFEEIQDCGYMRAVHDREQYVHSAIFNSIELKYEFKDKSDIELKIKSLFENSAIGTIYRIKGFARTVDGEAYEVNCTGELLTIEPSNSSENIIIIIGKRLKEKAIRNIINVYKMQ